MVTAFYLPDERAFIRYADIPGEDPPLLWLHGLMCSSTGELLPAAVQPELRERRSLLIDFLGHGYSDRPLGFGYAMEDHARTIVALIDGLGITDCAVIGHSRGGGVAILVASARPAAVSLLVMAEGNLGLDPGPPDSITSQSEEQFVAQGFATLLEAQTSAAEAAPAGLTATHIGITRLVAPQALHRAALSSRRQTDPPLRSLLKALPMPRVYLDGALSEPWGPREDLEASGVIFKTVPDAGHMMSLQNPQGLARAIAEEVAAIWRR